MTFEQAMGIVFDEIKKSNPAFSGFTPETAKAACVAWNIVAVAQNQLDNLAIVDANNNIVSLPLPQKRRIKGKGQENINEQEKAGTTTDQATTDPGSPAQE